MSDFDNIDVTILAGGLGTRLRKVVSEKPKALADINGRPFICYLLGQLGLAGASSVTLCTGYMGEGIEARLGTRYGRVSIFYSQEPEPLGTGGALRYAAQKLSNDWILAINGDSFLDANLAEYASWHREKDILASMIVVPVKDVSRYGSVKLGCGGKVLAFREKISKVNVSGYVNAGIYLIHKSVIQGLDFKQPCSLEHELLPAQVEIGLYGFVSKGRFIDIGTEESYRDAQAFFR